MNPASDLGPCLGCRTVVTRTGGFASTRTNLSHLMIKTAQSDRTVSSCDLSVTQARE